MINRKGIILAGGKGSRLQPITKVISKQLLPIYDKPMIYYPLSTLMLAGIRDILIITSHQDKDLFYKLLGNGSNFGVKINYAVQERPEGIPQAFIIGKEFINESNVTLILGDNLFHGNYLINQLRKSFSFKKGATIFAYPVIDPERYGVVEFNSDGKALKIEEKPSFEKYKRDAITNFVKNASKRIKAYQPDCIVSAAVKPNLSNAISTFGQEWDLWLKKGYVDWAVPMNYTKENTVFEKNIRLILENFPETYLSKIVMGIGIYNQDARSSGQKIYRTVKNNFGGVSIFSYTVFKNKPPYTKKIMKYLK